MQLILFLLLSFFCTAGTAAGTQCLLPQRRNCRQTTVLMISGILLCLIFSVLAECVLLAGKPKFYYFTHRPGAATLSVFGGSCLFALLFLALGIMIAERKMQRRSISRQLVLAVLLGMCGAALLEIGFFNFRHFELIGSGTDEITYSSDKVYGLGLYFNRASWKFHPYTRDTDLQIVAYLNNQKIRNISFEFDDGTPRTPYRIAYNDESHKDSVTLPEQEFIQGIPRSFTVPLHTVGKTYSIVLDLPKTDANQAGDYGISLPQITFNRIVPLSIDPVRFALSFLAIFVVTVFFPGSPVWKLPLDFSNFFQVAAAAALILLIFIGFVWTVFSSYSGSDLPITEQKAALNDNYDQYNKLVDALMVPRYALLDIPDHSLEQIDPYDMQQREKKKITYPWDTAYYEGKYYIYFGAVPAVTVLLPYKLLTGNYLDLDYPILGFCFLFVLGLYGIYAWFVQHCFPKISFGVYWMGLLLLITPLNLTWCLRRTLVYELAIMSGICFAVWGVYFILLSSTEKRMRRLYYFLSGSCTALAVGCRPTMIFVSIVVFTAAFCMMKENGKLLSRENVINALLFLIPYTAAGMALMKYNYERFDDPFEFGITWQLTTENRATGFPLLGPYGRALSMFASLFTMPVMDLKFPFIHLQQPFLPYNGQILNSDMVLGLFSWPIMAFLFLLPAFRKRLSSHGYLMMPFSLSCLAAALGICYTAADFSVANRYLTDYLWLAALPAVFVLLCFFEKCTACHWPEPAQTVVLVCGLIGVVLFAAVSLTGEDHWFSSINPLYFDRLRYAFSPWL